MEIHEIDDKNKIYEYFSLDCVRKFYLTQELTPVHPTYALATGVSAFPPRWSLS